MSAGRETSTNGPGMAALIQAAVHRAPGRLAVAAGGTRLSYGLMDELSRTPAGHLREAGVPAAGPVAVYCDNRPEFVLALLAAWSTGAAVVPLNPELTPAEVRARLAASGAAAVLLPRHLCDRYLDDPADLPAWAVELTGTGLSVTVARRTATPNGPATEAGVTRTVPPAGHIALLMFTTGSTGTPKIVPLTHANLAASVAGIVSTYRLGPEDATLAVMPLFHGHGLVAALLASLASGGAVHLPSTGRFSAGRFWDESAAANATWYTAVPTIHQILLSRTTADHPSALRFIRSCSAPLSPAVLHEMEDRFHAPVIEAYGMTETAHQATSNPLPQDGPRKDASVGLPTGPHVRVVTPGGTCAVPGETGEVCLRGPAVTSGYLNDPRTTAAAFTDGWFHTGDTGHLDPGGYLYLDGRIKDMINRGGEKIAPQTVDAVLLSHPAVQDALTFPVPDPTYGEEINAAVVLLPGHHTTEPDLRHHCRTHLAPFEIPKRIYFLHDLPKTSKGVGDRHALAAAATRPGAHGCPQDR